MNPFNILLLSHYPKYSANTIRDHIDAFSHYSGHTIFRLSSLGMLPDILDLNRFDAIVIHYSCSILGNFHINENAKKRIRDFSGLKILFAQDEYRLINKLKDTIRFLKIDVLFTCFPDGEIEKVYPSRELPRVTKINTLTGYVPESLLRFSTKEIKNRPVDVGYRARKVPFQLGELGVEKWKIVDDFLKYIDGKGLRVDLSYKEEDRIYGEKWIRFLSSCKTTLGVESGASVIDFTGELQWRVEDYLKVKPEASFEEVQELFLKDHEGSIKMNQISPRCFENACLKTVMILYEGEYSNILVPGKHYIPLKKDFSNIDDVLKILMDNDELQNIADCAYSEIALNPEYSYKKFIQDFDDIANQEYNKRGFQKSLSPYTGREFKKISKRVRLINVFNPIMLWNSIPNTLQKYLMPVLKPVYLKLLRNWRSPQEKREAKL